MCDLRKEAVLLALLSLMVSGCAADMFDPTQHATEACKDNPNQCDGAGFDGGVKPDGESADAQDAGSSDAGDDAEDVEDVGEPECSLMKACEKPADNCYESICSTQLFCVTRLKDECKKDIVEPDTSDTHDSFDTEQDIESDAGEDVPDAGSPDSGNDTIEDAGEDVEDADDATDASNPVTPDTMVTPDTSDTVDQDTNDASEDTLGDTADSVGADTNEDTASDSGAVTPDTVSDDTYDAGEPDTFVPKCKLGDCDDKNVCTTDECKPTTGCLFLANSAACTDGDLCTVGDVCKSKKCSAGSLKKCDDGVSCTKDSCEASGKCKNDVSPDLCDDGKKCTSDSCDPKAGCIFKKKSDCLPCKEKKECDDANSCTLDLCVKEVCFFEAFDGKTCDDGNKCTNEGTCKAKACLAGTKKVCKDANVCTEDSCDTKMGCLFLANSATCTDGDACTVSDVCKDKSCTAGSKKDCDDKNVCTNDSCDAKSGCTYTAKQNPCDDGNPCTIVDVCKDKVCKGITPKDCGDDDVCTADSCDSKTGKCSNTVIKECKKYLLEVTYDGNMKNWYPKGWWGQVHSSNGEHQFDVQKGNESYEFKIEGVNIPKYVLACGSKVKKAEGGFAYFGPSNNPPHFIKISGTGYSKPKYVQTVDLKYVYEKGVGQGWKFCFPEGPCKK
jgi:hypothetical protein